ncbi:SMC-Scp complex subunit ScpB [Planctomycetaceae bacterium SH139]
MERYGWQQRLGITSSGGPPTDYPWPAARRKNNIAAGLVALGHSAGKQQRWRWQQAASENLANDSQTVAVPLSGRKFWEQTDPLMKRQRVEAVLLLIRSPVASRKLAQLAGLADATEARTLVRQLNQLYTEQGRAFRAEEVAGGYQLLTRPALAPWLRRLGHIPQTIQLTPPAMETIAIVAYRQPVLRADIEAIRGVSCGEILRQLMDKDLVRISGRSEELGRPYLYATTKRFLQTFGLRGADALPALDQSEIDISDDPDWSDGHQSADANPDQQPVLGAPEEESDVSTAVADLVINPSQTDDERSIVDSATVNTVSPEGVIEDEEDELFGDDDDDVTDDDDEFDDDWADDDEDEEDDGVEDDDDEEDADWEEVDDDEDWEDDEEEDDTEDDLEDDDEWDDEDDDEDLVDDEDDEEWD